MNALVIRSAVVASVGGLIFGFDTAVISGAEKQIQEQFALGDGALGFTVTTALIGTIIGALVAGKPADRYGRKKVIKVMPETKGIPLEEMEDTLGLESDPNEGRDPLAAKGH